MTTSRPESVASPLTVKEQFEASAIRFWSSMRSLNIEDSLKGNSSLSRLKGSTSSDSQDMTVTQAVSFQSVMHAMFGSCTTGSSKDGYQNKASMSATGSSIAPVFSRDRSHTEPHLRRSFPLDFRESSGKSEQLTVGTAKTENVTPVLSGRVAPRTNFFQDNRGRTEEAVFHRQEQHIPQQPDLQHRLHQHQRKKDYERVVLSRSSNVQSTNNKHAAPTSHRRPHKGHPSFFPVSKPSTGRDPPGVLHTMNGPPIPKEVPSPSRRSGVPTEATVYPVTGQGDDIFDIEDDGVSVITQDTVDEMMRKSEQQQKVFPGKFLLNRVYSDDTDPVNPSLGPAKKQSVSKADDIANDIYTEGRNMSPPQLTRQNISSETRSIITKTTNSSQTDDFSEWKQKEQHYWDSQVAKDENSEACNTGKPARSIITSLSSISAVKNNLQLISPNLRSRKLKRVREKVKRNVVRLSHSTLPSRNSDQLIDDMILQNNTNVAEI
jgi:hypothetical protein